MLPKVAPICNRTNFVFVEIAEREIENQDAQQPMQVCKYPVESLY